MSKETCKCGKMSEKSIGSHLPVTLKYCSASATLVGNTLLIKRPKVLVPIHRADSLALKININRLDTKQPIYKQIKSNQFKNSIIFALLYVVLIKSTVRVAQFARVTRLLRIFAGDFSFCASTLHILCTEATCLVRRSYTSRMRALHVEYRVCWALRISRVRAAHLENARFTFCARTPRIL